MANTSNGKADGGSGAKKRRASPSHRLTGSSAAVRNFAGDKLLVGALGGSEGTKRRKVRSSTTMRSDGIILPRCEEEPGEQHPVLVGGSRSATGSGDGQTSSVRSIGNAEVAPSMSLLSPSLLGDMYLCGGYTGVEDFAGVDLLSFVQEHNSTLNFPQKVRS